MFSPKSHKPNKIIAQLPKHYTTKEFLKEKKKKINFQTTWNTPEY